MGLISGPGPGQLDFCASQSSATRLGRWGDDAVKRKLHGTYYDLLLSITSHLWIRAVMSLPHKGPEAKKNETIKIQGK